MGTRNKRAIQLYLLNRKINFSRSGPIWLQSRLKTGVKSKSKIKTKFKTVKMGEFSRSSSTEERVWIKVKPRYARILVPGLELLQESETVAGPTKETEWTSKGRVSHSPDW